MKFVVDGHCDAIYKLWKNHRLDFNSNDAMHVNLPNLKSGGVVLQSFALYLPPDIPRPQMYYELLKCIDLFHEKMIAEGDQLFVVRSAEDLERVGQGKIGSLLTLEGLDPVIGDMIYLKTLFHLGVRSIGFTWNQANLAADGVGDSRGAGLSQWGKEVVAECNRLGMMIDVSHMSEKAFWDTVEYTQRPLMASHSNVFDLCSHPRNLKEKQIKALIEMDGMIGLTFVPAFVHSSDPSMDMLLKHVEYICERGGADHLGFGSDFDGIETTLVDLENSGCYPNWIDRLLRVYSAELVEQWTHKNWLKFYQSQLPNM
jgi:membrane dipeptidase